MSNRFVIRAAPLPSDFRGTPQQLFEMMLDRIEVVSDGSLFVISDTMPSGNQGPWLKQGKQWWVWDTGTSTYIPLDVSASVSNEIFIGDVAPAPTSYKFWLKTAGPDLLGLYYYVGTTSGWQRVEALELKDDVITTQMLKNNVVTTDKIALKAVTPEKLADDLPLSKLVKGTVKRLFIRMNAAVSGIEWAPLMFESPEFAFITSSQQIQWAHGLGEKPNIKSAVYVCKTTEGGWPVGAEIDVFSSNEDGGSGRTPTLGADATNVTLVIRDQLYFRRADNPVTSFNPSPANWKVKFYAGIG
jgi:hypothetical protein